MFDSIFWNQFGACMAVLAMIMLAAIGEWCAYKDRVSDASRRAQQAERQRLPKTEEEIRDYYAAHRAQDMQAHVARLALEHSERAEGRIT